MVNYLEIINYIKNNYNKDWLTNSQKEAYNKVYECLTYDDVVGIYGNGGVGKTLLGWIFTMDDFMYFKNEKKYKEYSKNVPYAIIDNGSLTDIKDIRRLTMIKSEKVIYITKIKSVPYSIKLTPNNEDIAKVLDNLKSLNININKNYSNNNLWKIFKGVVYNDW
ncbi:hypothetical protein [Methanococcus aeolicus]|uniref:hypothetical protein n=1 Tax=Methanococcus aeolicus TaxID=42879 RepID=UPI0021C7DD81|nr:hypothetical protein [Methanococcus aeolicus]UXM84772.1 hypothetical protein N6C89_00280 [Methanococcus aeolicus]